jgi:hypothetical protein
MADIYVITLNGKFLDRGEWGWTWRYSLKDAYLFGSFEEARKLIVESRGFTESSKFSDGSFMPPFLIWSGLDINHAKPEATGTVRIMKVELQLAYMIEVSGQIQYPKED